MAQNRIPPAISGLFPQNVNDITGEFAANGPMIIADVSGHFRSSPHCSSSEQDEGGMHIQLTVYQGELAILAKRFTDGMSGWVKQEKEHMDSLIASWKGNSQIDRAGPVHEEDVVGFPS